MDWRCKYVTTFDFKQLSWLKLCNNDPSVIMPYLKHATHQRYFKQNKQHQVFSSWQCVY